MLNIAIDGPSGAGKSTIAKKLASILNIVYLDTGAMYRAIGLKAFRNNIEISNKEEIIKMLNVTRLDIQYKNGLQYIYLDGLDVSNAIREHHVSKLASDVSKIPEVRIKLVAIQRNIAENTDVVLDGRDITSYVLPKANYKFYLTASPEIRANRRCKELNARNQIVEYDKVLVDIKDRDFNDMNRDFAPLKLTADSTLIDSSNMNEEDVLSLILSYINAKEVNKYGL